MPPGGSRRAYVRNPVKSCRGTAGEPAALVDDSCIGTLGASACIETDFLEAVGSETTARLPIRGANPLDRAATARRE